MASLYKRILAKEQGALEELVTSHSARVQIIIHRTIEGYGELEDAEELASDVFFKVWQDIDEFDPSRGTFDKWINMIAKYTALDFRRKKQRRLKIMQSFLNKIRAERQEKQQANASTISSNGFELRDLLQILGEATRKLPKETQELIALRFGEGKTYKEIAELTGKPLGSVKSALHRALKRLRKEMAMLPPK